MTKYLLSIFVLTLISLGSLAQKVAVRVTMNNVSQTMTLAPVEGGDNIEVGTPANKVYSFEATPGDYILTGYNSSNINNGSIRLSITKAEDFSIQTCTAKATNKDWVLNSDYTVDVKVYQGKQQSIIVTGANADPQTAVTFLIFNGGSYDVNFIPSEAHANEGYMTLNAQNTVTNSSSVSKAIPMGYTLTFTAPKDAKVFVGSKIRHFVEFVPVEHQTVNEIDGNKTYTYKLAANTEYNYRVSATGKLTNAGVFKMPANDNQITLTDEDLDGDPNMIDENSNSNNGYNVADVFVNADESGCINLNVGEEFQLEYFRNWQIINTVTANYFVDPDFHFQVLDMNGNPSSDVVEIDEKGVIKAKANGDAIILVSYDAMRCAGQVGGPLFSAIWPKNTGLAVVRVGAADSGITKNMLVNEGNQDNIANKVAGDNLDAEIDVLYYTNDGALYTFTPEGATAVSIARPAIMASTVKYNGFVTDGVQQNADGSYTVKVTEGRNIIKLQSASGVEYQVVRGAKCNVTVTNETNPGEELKPGDNAKIVIDGLYHPCNKLSGIYNMNAKIGYFAPNASKATVAAKTGQYNFAADASVSARTITVTIPADWDEAEDFVLTGGAINCAGFGSLYGAHREVSRFTGANPNFTAAARPAALAVLPEICLYKGEKATADYSLRVLDFEGDKWNALIDDKEYNGSLLYGENAKNYKIDDADNTKLFCTLNNSYGAVSFSGGGLAVSNYHLNSYNGIGYTQQLSAYSADGSAAGNNGSNNFGVVYGYSDDSGFSADSRAVLTFSDNRKRVIDHLYINTNCYFINSITNGDGFSSAATKDDYVTVVFQNYADDILVKEVRYDLVKNGNVLTSWTKVDLSSLGEVEELKINFESSMVNTYGLSVPAYLLVDDIAVRFNDDDQDDNQDQTVTSATDRRILPSDNGSAYNLAGQRVGGNYRGMVIRNGKLIMQK